MGLHLWTSVFCIIFSVACSTGNQEDGGFTCPSSRGYFAHQTWCDRYYICFMSDFVLQKCKSGQLFDDDYKRCLPAKTVQCGSRKIPADTLDNETVSSTVGTSNTEVIFESNNSSLEEIDSNITSSDNGSHSTGSTASSVTSEIVVNENTTDLSNSSESQSQTGDQDVVGDSSTTAENPTVSTENTNNSGNVTNIPESSETVSQTENHSSVTGTETNVNGTTEQRPSVTTEKNDVVTTENTNSGTATSFPNSSQSESFTDDQNAINRTDSSTDTFPVETSSVVGSTVSATESLPEESEISNEPTYVSTSTEHNGNITASILPTSIPNNETAAETATTVIVTLTTPTSSTTEEPDEEDDDEPDIYCPQESGIFPHPTDKTKYLHCDSWYPYIKTCPPNLVFDPELEVCGWPKDFFKNLWL